MAVTCKVHTFDVKAQSWASWWMGVKYRIALSPAGLAFAFAIAFWSLQGMDSWLTVWEGIVPSWSIKYVIL